MLRVNYRDQAWRCFLCTLISRNTPVLTNDSKLDNHDLAVDSQTESRIIKDVICYITMINRLIRN